MKVLFFQNKLCSRAWKEAKILTDAGIGISLLELGGPNDLKDYSIFREHTIIPVEPDMRSMMKGKRRIVKGLKDLVEKKEFDLIHTHNSPDNLGVLVKKNLSIPLVHDIHDLGSVKPLPWVKGAKKIIIRKILNRWESYVCRKADGILTPSPELSDYVKKLYGTKLAGNVPNKPIDTGFRLRKKIDDGKIHMVHAGGISVIPEGERYLWPLFRKIGSHGIEVHVYAPIFDESLQKVVRMKCREIPGVHFHLPVPQDEIISEISKYHYGLALYSSFNESILRGAQNRIFEYQIAGLPVISNNYGYMGDYIKKKGCGEVIKDPDEVRDIVKNKKTYDLDNGDCFMQADNIIELYGKILEKG